jgi:hypothetical protein
MNGKTFGDEKILVEAEAIYTYSQTTKKEK